MVVDVLSYFLTAHLETANLALLSAGRAGSASEGLGSTYALEKSVLLN
jgi:ABC-type glucose/galactose transport system permease subunit